MDILKRGQIAVNKKDLATAMNAIAVAEAEVDAAMKEPSTELRGRRIAQAMNKITMARHSIQHFDLGIPLKKLK